MRFITFEGCDCSGKTTQINLLSKFLSKQGIANFVTREPGGTAIGEKIRDILLTDGVTDPLTEYLLLLAARREHINQVITPQLIQKTMVLSDRFHDSSVCYQGYLKGLNLEIMEKMRKTAINSFEPHITFLIDLPVDEINKRLSLRVNKTADHYDTQDLTMHTKIRNAFLKIAQQNTNRIVVINGCDKIKSVHEKIIQILSDKGLLK